MPPPQPANHVLMVRVDDGMLMASRPCTPEERDAAVAVVSAAILGVRPDQLPPPFIGWMPAISWAKVGTAPDPFGDTLPRNLKTPPNEGAQVRLSAIRAGSVFFQVKTASRTIRCDLDPWFDTLTPLVRVAQILRDGGFPWIVSEDRIRIVTRPVPEAPTALRLLVLDWQCSEIHAVVERAAFLAQWRQMLEAIADTEHLAHRGVLHGELPDTVVHEQADAAWQRLVAAGTPDDEDDEAEALFVGAYIARRIRLTPRQQAYMAAERQMLRTLVIPEEWPPLVGPDGRDEEEVEILLDDAADAPGRE
ncbi:hypothetical protein EBE87_23215 [Pseudoroseomonas wenyumeiae]|uniref:Uncharacterized protein n=1 Tax=Teichococcus wenyumeiae TaxID=2478470 RepID=A0A3A9JEI9_9PROT|nr:hypothetical protein D6Z83_08095 [Pseudoroseomonas wenyumeiae]RMI17337.1 hypothetical protein EBE87_23215 [Pseudoroseomonas wenyumeiae]